MDEETLTNHPPPEAVVDPNTGAVEIPTAVDGVTGASENADPITNPGLNNAPSVEEPIVEANPVAETTMDPIHPPQPIDAIPMMVEPKFRDVIWGDTPEGHVINELMHDIIRLERVIWSLSDLPKPTEAKDVERVCLKIMNVIQKGKPLELAGLKDVPRAFLRSTGRFLQKTDQGYAVMSDEQVKEALTQHILTEFHKDSSLPIQNFHNTPYKEMRELLNTVKKEGDPMSILGSIDPATPSSSSDIVHVPDPKDAILLRRGASNADKLYESHAGNKVVFTLISQVVTTYTTQSEHRVEAALSLLQGLQDAMVSGAPMNSDPTGLSVATSPGVVDGGGAAVNRKARFLLRNIREDESVFWSVLSPADASLFAICFAFEVYLEKEIYLQHGHQNRLVNEEMLPVMEYSNVAVETPRDDDVLFGRGGMTNAHPGNRRFRDVIALHRPDYIRALKMDKPGVARKIVKSIRRTGRFLKKQDDNKWYDVGDRTACEKTSQGLRERSNAEKRQRSALREALRIRRQDMSEDGVAADGKTNADGDPADKKAKTDPAANIAILNYVGTNMGVPLSLGMKADTTVASPTTVTKRRKSDGTGSLELFTEGLPPNAVDEDGNILVTDHDILCGRGGLTNHHKGNKRFRDIVALHRPDYVRAPKIQKPSVARVIVRAIRNGDPPGRFLRKDEKTGKWIDVGDKKAAEKTSQALREKTNEERDKNRRDILSLGPSANVLLPNASTTFMSASLMTAGIAPSGLAKESIQVKPHPGAPSDSSESHTKSAVPEDGKDGVGLSKANGDIAADVSKEEDEKHIPLVNDPTATAVDEDEDDAMKIDVAAAAAEAAKNTVDATITTAELAAIAASASEAVIPSTEGEADDVKMEDNGVPDDTPEPTPVVNV